MLGVTLIRGLLYAALIPPWQAPDETGHLEYAWLLAHQGHIPSPTDLSAAFEHELLASLYEWRFGAFMVRVLPSKVPARLQDLPSDIFVKRTRTVLSARFSLAYAWQALFILPVRHQDLILQLFAARLSSVLLNVLTVWIAYLTLCRIFPDRRDLVLLATAVIVWLPQHTFINSTVGEGPLAEVATCLALYCWIRLFAQGPTLWTGLGIVLGTAIGVASKNTAAFLIPLDVGLAGLYLVQHVRWCWTRKQILGLCGGAIVLAVGAWLWMQSPLGLRVLTVIRGMSPPAEWAWIDQRGITFGEGLLLAQSTFWALFGWVNVSLSERWYGALTLLSAAALCGWCQQSRARPSGQAMTVLGAAFGLAFAIFVWAAFLSRQGGYYQFQGRYLYPVIVPYSVLLVGGLDRLVRLQNNRLLQILSVLFLLVLDTWALSLYVLPYYYG